VQCTDDADCAAKRGHWEKHHDMIEKHNEEFRQGLHPVELQHTIHSHYNEEERKHLLGFNYPEEGTIHNPKYEDQLAEYNRTMSLKSKKEPPPEEIDWRNHNGKNYVTPVKSQPCGSCWTFAATAVLESQWAIKHNGEQILLSEQNIIDCSWTGDSRTPYNGCEGGMPYIAWQYVKSTEDNPATPEQTRVKGKSYTGQNYANVYPNMNLNSETPGECKFRDTPVQIGLRSWKITIKYPLKMHNKPLMEAVATDGPVAVGIDMTDRVQAAKGGGIIPDQDDDYYCGKKPNHAVTLVGYGERYDAAWKKKVKFWLIKNSYGTHQDCGPGCVRPMGDNGYWRLYRSDNMSVEEADKEKGTCGILTYPHNAVIEEPNQE